MPPSSNTRALTAANPPALSPFSPSVTRASSTINTRPPCPPSRARALHAGELADYTDFFLAQALNGAGQSLAAATALAEFDKRNPDSVLSRDAVLLRATALVSAGEAQTAVKLLEPLRAAGRADVELGIGRRL